MVDSCHDSFSLMKVLVSFFIMIFTLRSIFPCLLIGAKVNNWWPWLVNLEKENYEEIFRIKFRWSMSYCRVNDEGNWACSQGDWVSPPVPETKHVQLLNPTMFISENLLWCESNVMTAPAHPPQNPVKVNCIFNILSSVQLLCSPGAWRAWVAT